MKNKTIRYVCVMLLVAASHISFGQYFQRLVDCDSTLNWGWDIFSKTDGNYFVMGWGINQTTNKFLIFNMTLNNSGDVILNQNVLKIDSASIGTGNPGEAKELPGGGYIIPVSLQRPRGSYLTSQAGLLRYNALGDTVFLKTYTDTAVYFANMYTCAVMDDGGYAIGGARGHNTPSIYPGYLIRTDSMGDTIWTHAYQKDTAEWVEVNSIVPIGNGRLLVGAMSSYWAFSGSYSYSHNAPWFMILDSVGGIVRDTVYGNVYGGGGRICKDVNGGYFHTGEFDSLYTTTPSDIENFPSYIAKLDTDFRIAWITSFTYSGEYGHRDIEAVRQLKDSSYIVIGDAQTHYPPYSLGWAAKIDKNGQVVWNHKYMSGFAQYAYFRDVVEKPDGSFVFIGSTFNDTLPSWHQHRDMWLVEVDSNGCEVAGCGVTGVGPSLVLNTANLFVFPNPNSGSFTIKLSTPADEPVHIMVTDITGKKVKELSATTNLETEMSLTAPAGLYFISASTATGRWVRKVVVE